MNSRLIAGVVGGITFLLILGLLTGHFRPAVPPENRTLSETKMQVVPTVGRPSTTLAEIEHVADLPLHQVEEQRMQVLNESIQQLIEDGLLAIEAARKGLSVSELTERESESGVGNYRALMQASDRQQGLPQDRDYRILRLPRTYPGLARHYWSIRGATPQ